VKVTELFLPCSPAAPFKVLREMTAGTAGVMGLGRPFTGCAVDLPFWLSGAADPSTTGGWEPTINGVAVGFLDAPTAEAYDGAEEAEGVVAEVWGC
jgi:hypothetical protein